jgi:hypothetical protein
MNKKLVSISLGAGLAAGSLAGMIAVPAISSAQTATTAATATTSTDQGRPDPSAHLADTLKPLVDAGTITQAQADAVITALKASAPMGGHGPSLDVVAQALGMSEADLHTALEGGQTLAQVAASKGVNVQVVIDAMVAAETTHINQGVTDGKLTQAQADERLANVTQHVTDMVNNPRPAPGQGHGGPDARDAAASATTTN